MWTIWSCRKRESQLESHSFHADISQQPHPEVSSPLQSRSRQCGPEHQDWHHSWHSPSLPDAPCYASMLQCDPSQIYRAKPRKWLKFIDLWHGDTIFCMWIFRFPPQPPGSQVSYTRFQSPRTHSECYAEYNVLYVLSRYSYIQYVQTIFSYIPYRSLYIIYTYFSPFLTFSYIPLLLQAPNSSTSPLCAAIISGVLSRMSRSKSGCLTPHQELLQLDRCPYVPPSPSAPLSSKPRDARATLGEPRNCNHSKPSFGWISHWEYRTWSGHNKELLPPGGVFTTNGEEVSFSYQTFQHTNLAVFDSESYAMNARRTTSMVGNDLMTWWKKSVGKL